jgi:Tfp pilus assembly protein PilO
MRIEKQQLGIFAVVGVIVVAFVMLQYGPLLSSIRITQQVKAAQLSAETKTDEQAKRLPILRTQLEQMQAKVGNYDAKIPADRKLGMFLQEIADAMTKHSLSEQVVQPDSETQAENLTCIPLRIQGKGTIRQLFDFFRSLETVNRLVRIEQVQLRNSADLSGSVTMTAKANIYYEMPKSQGGSQ